MSCRRAPAARLTKSSRAVGTFVVKRINASGQFARFCSGVNPYHCDSIPSIRNPSN